MATNQQVSITLVAQDRMSQSFKAAADNGKRLETSLRQVDTAGKQASAGLDRTEQSTRRLSAAGAAMGAAFGVGMAALQASARVAAEAEASQARLRTAVENTGATFEEYEAQLAAAGDAALQMAFDDEAAYDALSTLTAGTGDATTAIADLSLVMDVARGRGIDLAAATNIVLAAEQGRFTSLKRLGIAIDENATREEALAALQAKYAGQAEAYAETNAAAHDRMRNSLEEHLESVGSLMGEYGQLLLILPAIGPAFTGISTAVGALAGASLLGPVGLVAAAGLALGGMVALGAYLDEDFTSHAGEAEQATANLNEQLTVLGEQGVLTGSRLNLGQAAKGLADLVAAADAEALHDVADELVLIQSRMTEDVAGVGVPLFEDLTEAQRANIDADHDQVISKQELSAAIALANEQAADAADANRVMAAISDDVTFALGEQGEAAVELQRQQSVLIGLYISGQMTGDAVIASIEGRTAAYREEAAAAAVAGEAEATYTRQSTAMVDSLIAGTAKVERMQAAVEHDRQARNTAMIDSLMASTEAAAAQTDAVAHAERGNTAYIDSLIASTAAIHEQVEAFNAVRDAALAAAEAVDSPLEALATGVTVIIDNTDAIASSAQGVADWADELIAPVGTLGKIDQLLADGVISLGDYTRAQDAQTRIGKLNANIQRDVLEIQTKQAPVLAELMGVTENYVAELSEMDGRQQLAALGFMDMAESTRALDLATAASAASTEQQVEAVSAMIEGAAAADPVLASMLETMGLISIGADGTITVNTEGFGEAQDQTDRLIEAIEDLTEATWIAVLGLEDNATPTLNNVLDLMNTVDGRVATAYINTVYQTFGSLDYVAGSADSPFQHGGVIPGAQHGRMLSGLAWVGEAGPELISAPGAYVTPHTASTQGRQPGGPGGVTVNVYGNVYGIDDLAQEVSRAIVPAIERASYLHAMGHPS